MLALDTSFLIDYLDGAPAAGTFIEERRTQPFHAPTLALFEVYRGGARTGGREHVERVRDALMGKASPPGHIASSRVSLLDGGESDDDGGEDERDRQRKEHKVRDRLKDASPIGDAILGTARKRRRDQRRY